LSAEDPPHGQEADEGSLEEYPESFWERLHEVAARFEAELQFADAFLEDNTTSLQASLMLGNSSELRRVAILQRLVEKAYSLRLYKPDQGLRIVEDVLTWTQTDSSRLVSVFRARSLMERGNFLRILGNPDSAKKSFAMALEELERCAPNDPLEVARYQELLGTLERDCGNYEAAADLLSKALAKVRRWGDQYSLQRILIAAGLAHLYNDSFEEADKLLDESLRIAEPDSLFLRFAAVNKVLSYLHRGQPHKAYQALLRVRSRLGDSWLLGFPEDDRMRVLWVEGQILNALGMGDEATTLLRRSRNYFIQANRGYEVCRLSIELALSYATLGQFEEVSRELAFTLPFLSAQKTLDRYAHAAVLVLQQSLQKQGRLYLEQIRQIAERLDSIHRAPLRAQPQSPFADLQL
jgi:tetratricopeptide (TPR) repeat protein